jgi:hypothetical protein
MTSAASPTGAAGHLKWHHHTLADPVYFDRFAGGDDFSDNLVTHGEGSREQPGGNHLHIEVAAADRTRPHPDCVRIKVHRSDLLKPFESSRFGEHQLAHSSC